MGTRAKYNHLPCRDKRRYASGKAARRALLTIRKRGEKRPETPSRAYPCPDCHGWHLTHQGQGRP